MAGTPKQPHRPDEGDRDRSETEERNRPDEDETTEAFQRALERVRRRRRNALDELADK